MSNIRTYLPPPPFQKKLQLQPYRLGSEFHNLTSGHYENNNKLSVFLSTDFTEKISKIILSFFFYYVFILALTLEPTSLIQGP